MQYKKILINIQYLIYKVYFATNLYLVKYGNYKLYFMAYKIHIKISFILFSLYHIR